MSERIKACKIFEFEAAHFLFGYKGKCKNMHGHSYKLEIEFSCYLDFFERFVCESNPSSCMVMDFSVLKKVVNKKIIGLLDHKLLNDVEEDNFPWWMPTAENMVVWIFKKLNGSFAEEICSRVRLWETSTSFAEISK